MITYYRTYYDSRLLGDYYGNPYGNIGYIYITKQLPKQEMSQAELAEFISSNPEDILFKYQLGRDIYAISRYVVSTKGIKIPVDKENLIDLFIFPSTIKNKAPFCVSSGNVGTTLPRTIKTEVENFSSYILPYIGNLVTNKTGQENFSEFYRKARSGLLDINSGGGGFVGQTSSNIETYQTKINKPLVEKLTIKSLSIKNANRIKPVSNIYYQMNQDLRCIDESDYISLTEQEKSQTKLDFSSLDMIKMFDFNDLNKIDSYGMWLKQNQSYQKIGTQAYYQPLYNNMVSYGDMHFMRPIANSEGIISAYSFGAYNTQIIRFDNNNPDELSGINLLNSSDLSGMDLEYLSDKTYFSLINNFETQEKDSILKLYDSSYLNLQKSKSWINTGTYDTTSWFFKELDTTDHAWAVDPASQIVGAEYQFSINGLKGYITKNSKLSPIRIKSQIIEDKNSFVSSPSYQSNLQAILSIQYLTKDTMDQLNNNNYSNTYEQLLNNFNDLTELKYNHHFLIYDLKCNITAIITSKTLAARWDLTDQSMFSFDSSDLTTFTTSQHRVFINHQEDNTTNKITLSKFITRYTHGLIDPYYLSSKWNTGVETTTDRSVYLYDTSMNLLTSFQYTPRYTNNTGSYIRTTQLNYTCNHPSLTESDLSTICQNQINDTSHYCIHNIINYIYGLEDSLVINDVPISSQNEFKFNDSYNIHVFSYVGNVVSILPFVRSTCQAISKTTKLTQGNQAKQVWNFSYNGTTNPAVFNLRIDSNIAQQSSSFTGSVYQYIYGYRAGHVFQSKENFYQIHTYHGNNERFISTTDSRNLAPYADITEITSQGVMFYQALPSYGEYDSEYQWGTFALYDSIYVISKCHVNTIKTRFNYSQNCADTETSGCLTFSRSIEPNFHIPYCNENGGASQRKWFSEISDIFTSMTPFDLIIKNDSTTFTRLLSSLSPYWKWGRELEYTVSNIDTTNYIPISFLIKPRMTEYFGRTYSNTYSEYNDRVRSQGYFVSRMQSLGNYRYSIGSQTNIFENFKTVPIDQTNSITYLEPELLLSDSVTWNTNTIINNSISDHHYRTPSTIYLSNLNDLTVVKHNAILDYIMLKMSSDSSGYIIPFKEITNIVSFNYESLGIDQTPHQNKVLLTESGDVSVFVMGDMMCVNDIESIDEMLISDTSIKIDFTKYTGAVYSRNLGEPIIYFMDDNTTFEDTTINIIDLINDGKFGNFGVPDLRYSFCGTTDNFIKTINHSVNLTYDALNQDFVINKISDITTINNTINFVGYVPTLDDAPSKSSSSDIAFNTITTNNQLLYYRSTHYSFTGQNNIQNAMDLIITDYTYENSNIYENSTITRYIIDRLNVVNENIIQNGDLLYQSGLSESLIYIRFKNFINNCIIEANNIEGLYITPYDLFSMIIDSTDYPVYVIRLNKSYIIADILSNKIYTIYIHNHFIGEYEDNKYIIFNWSSVDFSNNFDNMIWSTTLENNVYVQNVYQISRYDTNLNALMLSLTSSSDNPYGNMYILSDYSQLMMQETLKELLNTF